MLGIYAVGKYLPVWVLFFLLAGVIYNSLTRINNAPAWVSYLLVAVVSCGGLAVMFAYDYGKLFATGVRGIQYIPGTTSAEWLSAIGMSFPTALAGIMLFGLLFILNLGVGVITPPVGTVLYVVCGVGNIKITKLVQGMLPFLVTEIIMLFLLLFFPSLSLTPLNWLMGG